ncbi:MAG: class I SAM-dependent methyltransferase [Planctomycetota bacterium]|nr:class I SAM-dependent methyltransferase [Planctomycetota bacterium]MDA1211435.1 class I SAM-dependent methyltransferase [Planctomycetota bacterium]
MAHHRLRDLNLTEFRQGMRVLDVGCGYGRELQRLADLGCTPVGLDPFAECVERSRQSGFETHQGYAEQLPFADSSFDGVISQVALPYTNDSQAVSEIARVLKPGGVCYLSTHGIGYYWLILSQSRKWQRACYALRCIANTWFYRLTGKKLPQVFGDTIYQSDGVLTHLANRVGLEISEQDTRHRFWGMPVFIYSAFRKPVTAHDRNSTATIEEQLLKQVQAISEAIHVPPTRVENVVHDEVSRDAELVDLPS